MILTVDVLQPLVGDVRIYLSSHNTFVPQKFLNSPNVHALCQQVSGVGMSERVRGGGDGYPG